MDFFLLHVHWSVPLDYHLKFYILAVQNERQPRNSAQIRHDQLDDITHPMVAVAATVSATHPAFTPANNHRLMTGLLSEISCKQLDQEDGKFSSIMR